MSNEAGKHYILVLLLGQWKSVKDSKVTHMSEKVLFLFTRKNDITDGILRD